MTSEQTTKAWYSPREAAFYFGVSEHQVKDAARGGRIPYIRLGSRPNAAIRIPASAIFPETGPSFLNETNKGNQGIPEEPGDLFNTYGSAEVKTDEGVTRADLVRSKQLDRPGIDRPFELDEPHHGGEEHLRVLPEDDAETAAGKRRMLVSIHMGERPTAEGLSGLPDRDPRTGDPVRPETDHDRAVAKDIVARNTGDEDA